MKREYLLSGSPFFLYPLRKFIRSIEVEILPQCGFSVVLLASSLPALHDEEKERLQVLIRQTEGAPIAIERKLQHFVHHYLVPKWEYCMHYETRTLKIELETGERKQLM